MKYSIHTTSFIAWILYLCYLHSVVGFCNPIHCRRSLRWSVKGFAFFVEAKPPIPERQIVNLFSRLAEKRLLLNIPEAGLPEVANCCHSGCDNCAYSRVFDELNAARAKWIPFYDEMRFIDGRRHESRWKAIFTDRSAVVSVSHLADCLSQLSPQLCIGTPYSISDEEQLDLVAVETFLIHLFEGLQLKRDERVISYEEVRSSELTTFLY